MKPSIGRIVHFVMRDGVIRPAIIVHTWSDVCVNLQVFPDGPNDGAHMGTQHETSVSLDAAPKPSARTWHWPPREGDVAGTTTKPAEKPATQSVSGAGGVESKEAVGAV